VVRWGEFAAQSPELAAIGAERFRKHLMGWLGTSRADGSVRIHAVTPLVASDGELYLFMEPTSPKGQDLIQRGTYALHCHVPDIMGTWHGEFLATGWAAVAEDARDRQAAAEAFRALGFSDPPDRYMLFKLAVGDASGTAGGDEPTWLRWRAPTGDAQVAP